MRNHGLYLNRGFLDLHGLPSGIFTIRSLSLECTLPGFSSEHAP